MSTSFVKPSRWLRRWWPLLGVGLVMVAVLALVSMTWWIQIGARQMGTAAMKEYRGDRVQALIAMVDSDRHPLGERNRAVWALGQMRDPRGLSVLRKYYTGQRCDHDRYLCQNELKKAIDLCEKRGFDLVRWTTPDSLRH